MGLFELLRIRIIGRGAVGRLGLEPGGRILGRRSYLRGGRVACRRLLAEAALRFFFDALARALLGRNEFREPLGRRLVGAKALGARLIARF